MTWVVLVLIGLAAGVLSGLFGVGGGIIIVPALVLLLGYTAQQAAGTSLAALVIPVGIFIGALQYWRAGQIEVGHAVFVAIGLAVGAYLGARLGLSLPGDVVQRAFGVLLVVVGLRMTIFA